MNGVLRLRLPTSSCAVTSPIAKLTKAGCTWPLSLICLAVRWSAGACSLTCKPAQLKILWQWLGGEGGLSQEPSSTATRRRQYCSYGFQAALAKWGMRLSMSRKGNCWDNSPIESLQGALEDSLRAWAALHYPRASKVVHHELDGILQLPQIAFELGLPQPDAIRKTLVRGTAQKSRVSRELRMS